MIFEWLALQAAGADPNEPGGRPLIGAAYHGRTEVVQALLDAGASHSVGGAVEGLKQAVSGWQLK